jgi:hypothetical protein
LSELQKHVANQNGAEFVRPKDGSIAAASGRVDAVARRCHFASNAGALAMKYFGKKLISGRNEE